MLSVVFLPGYAAGGSLPATVLLPERNEAHRVLVELFDQYTAGLFGGEKKKGKGKKEVVSESVMWKTCDIVKE